MAVQTLVICATDLAIDAPQLDLRIVFVLRRGEPVLRRHQGHDRLLPIHLVEALLGLLHSSHLPGIDPEDRVTFPFHQQKR